MSMWTACDMWVQDHILQGLKCVSSLDSAVVDTFNVGNLPKETHIGAKLQVLVVFIDTCSNSKMYP